jgi:hypothetical protein
VEVSAKLLEQARAVFRYSPTLAAEVRDGRLAAGLGVPTAAFFHSSRARLGALFAKAIAYRAKGRCSPLSRIGSD